HVAEWCHADRELAEFGRPHIGIRCRAQPLDATRRIFGFQPESVPAAAMGHAARKRTGNVSAENDRRPAFLERTRARLYAAEIHVAAGIARFVLTPDGAHRLQILDRAPGLVREWDAQRFELRF